MNGQHWLGVGRGFKTTVMFFQTKDRIDLLVLEQINLKHYVAQRLESKVILGGYIPLIA
jgi:hypothetical protein